MADGQGTQDTRSISACAADLGRDKDDPERVARLSLMGAAKKVAMQEERLDPDGSR